MNAPLNLTSKLDAALALHRRGLRIFPLRPNEKTPLREGWQDWATAATEQDVANHWTHHPECNIGIATGDYGDGHNLIVVDLDVKPENDGTPRAGPAELERLARNPKAKRPVTLEAETASGGRHLLSQSDSLIANSAGDIAPGIDVRGKGGYIVAPGSTIDRKAYRWVDADAKLAPWPEGGGRWNVTLAIARNPADATVFFLSNFPTNG
jgi:hypothetical protein